jgi:uncharacterized protein YebE (UPF0316 family)
VSIDTVRTIVTVQGRTTIAFTLVIFEIIIWVTVASTVINQISDKPLVVIFYTFGYPTGRVLKHINCYSIDEITNSFGL